MSKIIVSLVSEQSAPNIMFIKQFGEQADKFLFISTPDMESKGKSYAIVKAAGIELEKTDIIQVAPNSFEDVPLKLGDNEFISDCDEFLVNLTLGTKMMALGAYDFFSRHDNSKIFYVPFGFNGYKEIFPNIGKEVLFESKVSITEYLDSYGIPVKSTGKADFDEQLANKFFIAFLNFQEMDFNILEQIRKLRNGYIENGIKTPSKKKIYISSINGLDLLLANLNFKPKQDGILSSSEMKYLTGGWFEEWVYYKLKSKLNLFDNEIAIGVHTHIAADNDLDIVIMLSNEIHIIECKTRVDEYLAETTIYKSGALNDKFGKNAHSYIFTLSNLRDDNGIIKEKFRKRAEQQKIIVADKEDLTNNLDTFLSQNFKL